jgi:hypothetical protein
MSLGRAVRGCQGYDTADEVQRDPQDPTDAEIYYGVIAVTGWATLGLRTLQSKPANVSVVEGYNTVGML